MRMFIDWYKYTAGIVGLPVLFVMLFWGMQKTLFTGTCMIAGWKCQHAFAVAEALESVQAGNDLVVARRKN